MWRNRVRSIASALACLALTASGTVAVRAATTPRAAPPIESVYCQLEADGQCHCGPRQGTGRNIPCRPEATQPPLQRYGRNEVLCDASNSQGASRIPSETWDRK